MEQISAVIITQNEERNIGRCLESLKEVADEVIVVDSGSTDGTADICRKAGARFEHHDWQGYSGQKNYANRLASHPWILSIDADEALSPALRESILALKRQGLSPSTVYAVNRLNNYCGQWIHHCGWYPDWKIRLWRNGAVEWVGEVHEDLQFLQTHLSSHTLEGDLLHYSYYSVADHAARQVRYATLAARKAQAAGKRAGALDVWLRPGWTFARNYLFKGGFLDGHAGYTVCRMSAFYTFIKYALLRELNRQAFSPASIL